MCYSGGTGILCAHRLHRQRRKAKREGRQVVTIAVLAKRDEVWSGANTNDSVKSVIFLNNLFYAHLHCL